MRQNQEEMEQMKKSWQERLAETEASYKVGRCHGYRQCPQCGTEMFKQSKATEFPSANHW